MAYNPKVVRESVINEWSNYDLFVLPYFSKRSGQNNDVTEFILSFKNNWSGALRLASILVGDAVAANETQLRDEYECEYVLAAPSSSMGTAGIATEYVCEMLASRFSWLTHLRGALQRTTAVAKSAYAAPGERPGYQQHLETISYVGPTLNLGGKGVILFDDVFTRGKTSSACRTIIWNATRSSYVIGVFLGRTQ